MNKIKEMVERRFVIPCGPMLIRADSVCRKSLRDTQNRLLDRLSMEVTLEDDFQEELQGNGKLLQDISGRM
jgi:hypothetical protein